MNKFLLLIILIVKISVLSASSGESVVCIHGFFRSYRCMMPIGNVLSNEGYSVFLVDYPSRRATIEEHASELIEILHTIAHNNPKKPIHFVSHSLGGVIVRAAVSHPNCPYEAKIGRAILLAPPNKGSCLARQFKHCPAINWLFGKKSGRQLLTYTEYEMQEFGRFPEAMQVMVLAGQKGTNFSRRWIHEPNDGKVTIEETRLDTPHDHYTLMVGHSWIMTSRESIEIIKRFIVN